MPRLLLMASVYRMDSTGGDLALGDAELLAVPPRPAWLAGLAFSLVLVVRCKHAAERERR